MTATINAQVERELTIGEQVIKTIESNSDLSEVSRKAVITELKFLQRQHRSFKTGNSKVMLTVGLANLLIGTLMIIFVNPIWGLFCYLGVAICAAVYTIGFFGSRKYLKVLQQHTKRG